MSITEEPRQDFDFRAILDFLNRHKWGILLIAIGAGILAAIFSGPAFIPEKFSSTQIFYPVSTNSISKAVLPANASSDEDLLRPGEDEEAERMLQVLNSDIISGTVIRHFNLMDHYRINPDGAYPLTALKKKYASNVKVRRTEYNSIEITVLDESRDTAALMANFIGDQADSFITAVQQQRARSGYDIVYKSYNEKQAFIASLVDSLQKLGAMGVLNFQEQSNALTTAYGTAIISGNASRIAEVKKQLDIIGRYGPIHASLLDKVTFETDELAQLRNKLEQSEVDANASLSNRFIYQMATPAERKSYPIRWLVVAVSMASAALISILLYALRETLRSNRRLKGFHLDERNIGRI